MPVSKTRPDVQRKRNILRNNTPKNKQQALEATWFSPRNMLRAWKKPKSERE